MAGPPLDPGRRPLVLILRVTFNIMSSRHGPRSPGLGASARPVSESKDLRCACGSLLARLVDGGIELRCRRCRRSAVIDVLRLGESGPLEVRLVLADDGALRGGKREEGEP